MSAALLIALGIIVGLGIGVYIGTLVFFLCDEVHRYGAIVGAPGER